MGVKYAEEQRKALSNRTGVRNREELLLWASNRTTFCSELTFHSSTRPHFYKHPLADMGECRVG
jgi:hypothetical protein